METKPKRLSLHRCRWCDGEVELPRRTWCSDACVLEFTRRNHQASFAAYVWSLSNKCCAVCRMDIDAAERLYRSLDLTRRDKLREMIGLPRDGHFWEADHIVPQAFNGHELDPKHNGRVLCRRCHNDKTQQDREAIRLHKKTARLEER